MYAIISDILKYAFVVVVYIFIYSVVKLVYLDISDARRMNKAEDDGYLKLINLRKDLSCRVFESYSLREASVIGRSRKCDIYINNPYLSKEHARISFEDGKFYIEDLKSTNGTYLNGNKLGTHPVKLKDNDKISFGDISFLFVDGGVAIG